MSQYLHLVDLKNELKCLNIYATRTLHSLFALQLFTEDRKPNTRNIDLDELANLPQENIFGVSSPKMFFLFQKALLNNKATLTEQEHKQIRIADIELAMERVRRDIAQYAPSRLSALYLVEKTTRGRDILSAVLGQSTIEPYILEVDILNSLEIYRCDAAWIERYKSDPQDEFLINYWNGTQANEYPFGSICSKALLS
jgi:hypothetical protein